MPSDSHADSAPRVFLSYSHDSEKHRARVLTLSNRLRDDGIDAHIDRYVRGTPPDGWPTWMANEIDDADFVLVVCTATYDQRVRKREAPGKGLGATWEGGIVSQVIYDAQGRNTKFIPVLFEEEDVAHIPVFLRGATRYHVGTHAGYAALLDYLTGHHDAPMPPLGPARGGDTRRREPVGTAGRPPVAEVASSGRPSSAVPASTPAEGRATRARSGNPLAGREAVVIRFADGHVGVFGADRIEQAEALALDLVALTPAGAERLQALQGRSGRSHYGAPSVIAVAYGAAPTGTATWARVRDVGQEIAAGTTRWRLTLELLEPMAGVMDDVTFNSVSPDDIAGWRARRILLDERPTSRRPGDPMPGALGRGERPDPMLETMVSGTSMGYGRDDGRSLGAVEGSPLRPLFAAWTADPETFLIAAHLVATLWLVLTRTVERVRRLELAFAGDDRLTVTFEGVRRRVYTNRDPVQIVVTGECPLGR